MTACPEYAVGNEASAESHATGEPDSLGYWAARRYLPQVLDNYRGSVFFVQGLQDWNVNPGQQWPLADELEERGVRVHYMLGQWGHSNPDQAGGAARRPDWGDILLEWYDAELKGRPNVTTGAEVQDSTGKWRREATWPPQGEQRTFTLEPAGRLAETASGAKGSVVLGPDAAHTQPGAQQLDLPDALDAGCPASPAGCAAFTTAPVTADLRIAGLPRLRLPVTPRGATGHVSAYLYALDAAGAARRIGWAQADRRFPRGTDERATVTPGQVVELDFPVQPLDAVVPAARAWRSSSRRARRTTGCRRCRPRRSSSPRERGRSSRSRR